MFVSVGITTAFYWVGSSSTILLLNMSNETSLLSRSIFTFFLSDFACCGYHG